MSLSLPRRGSTVDNTPALTIIDLTDSGDEDPVDVHIVHQDPSPSGQPFYFTSDINEGYSNVEEVVEEEEECDTIIHSPDITVLEDTEEINVQSIKDSHTLHMPQVSSVGENIVQYGNQKGHASSTATHKGQDVNTESDEESEKELLLAEPFVDMPATLVDPGSPILTIYDLFDKQTESEELKSILSSDSNESTYRLFSDDSSDSLFANVEEKLDNVSNSSVSSVQSVGNIPDFEALGVKKESPPRTPVTFSRSLSVSEKVRTTPSMIQVTSSTSRVAFDIPDSESAFVPIFPYKHEKHQGKSKSFPSLARREVFEKPFRKPYRYVTTSTQSAINEKLKFKHMKGLSDSEDDIVSMIKDKTKPPLEDSDQTSKRSKHVSVGSSVDTAKKEGIAKSQSIMPLKEELKLKIQVDRMKRGEPPELILKEDPPPKYMLRPDEIEKREHRLRQNRESAHRSRVKAYHRTMELQKSIKEEMNTSAKLRHEIMALRVQKGKLRRELDEHIKVCTRKLPSTSE